MRGQYANAKGTTGDSRLRVPIKAHCPQFYPFGALQVLSSRLLLLFQEGQRLGIFNLILDALNALREKVDNVHQEYNAREVGSQFRRNAPCQPLIRHAEG